MKNRFKLFLSLTILYAMLIFYLSSKSNLGDPRALLDMDILRSIIHYFEGSDLKFLLYPLGLFYQYPDKTVHMIEYAVFGFLLYLTLKNSPYPSFRDHAMLFAIAIGIMYGISDEFHQSFVPGRTASILDLVADAMGVTLAQTFIFIKDKLCIKHIPKTG
jgi:VanZ family protein